MNSARKLAGPIQTRRFSVLQGNASANLAKPVSSDHSFPALLPQPPAAQPYRGLHLVKPGEAKTAQPLAAESFEQARRIVDQIEQEIVRLAEQNRSARLRVVSPASAASPLRQPNTLQRTLRAVAARLQELFGF
jgi:hypothetical protein